MNIVRRINQIIHEIRNVPPASLPDLSTTWQDKNIPLKQACVADKELIDTRNGKPPEIFVTAANLLKKIPQDREYSFLDIACGYGYYSEVISLLVPNLMIEYIGGDFNSEMLTLARQRYPALRFQNQDIRALTMQDESADIVFSSATIMHLLDYKVGLRELARVCRSWLVLHRLGVVWRKKSSIEIKHHYDVDVYAHNISRDELLQEMNALGYKLVAEEPLSKRTPSRRQSMSFLFKRKESSPQVLRKG